VGDVRNDGPELTARVPTARRDEATEMTLF
jgi:hypothetical protein